MHKGTAYLLHVERGLDNRPGVRNRHYLGFTEGAVEDRIAAHRAGRGSAFMAEVSRQGQGFTLARVWRNVTRSQERKLKDRKNAPRLCPVCAQEVP